MDKNAEIFKVHPVAEAYRLMTDDELGALAESVRENGLRYAISIGIVGEERWLADGRNRLRACEMADVEPRYEEIEFVDDAALRAFIVDMNERRSITKGQKAMGYALIFPQAYQKRARKNVLAAKTFSEALLSQARAVVSYSLPLAESVRDGSVTLSEALERARKEMNESAEKRLERLRARAPDLAARVDEEGLALNEAEAALAERESFARRTIEQAKKEVDSGLNTFSSAVTIIMMGAKVASEPLVSEERMRFATEAYERLKCVYDAQFERPDDGGPDGKESE